MANPLEELLRAGQTSDRFPPSSRYHGLPVLELSGPDGRAVRYGGRRFIPPEPAAPGTIHVVSAGERPDHLAHLYLGDATRFWRLCDANETPVPGLLTAEPGAVVAVPAGAPGAAPSSAF